MSIVLIPAVNSEVSVPYPVQEVFDFFINHIATWWPQSYTWSHESLVDFGIEPRLGGLCYEKAMNNFTLNWGTVTLWEPPFKLRLAWQIGPGGVPQPNISQASEVVISFESLAVITKIKVSHFNFHRHGPKALEYRNALASLYGWEYILECFKLKTHEHFRK